MGTRNASLSELMGSAASGGLKLSNLHELLGHATPELPRDAVGRHRLIMALHQRFGPNFRSLPGISGLIKQFDDELAVEKKVAQIKQIKLKGK